MADTVTGKEIYNTLMAQIEPDLVEDMLPLLDAKYAKETPRQKAARMARYERAFAEYDKRFTAFMNDLQEEVHEVKRAARASAEQEAAAEDAQKQEDLLKQISSI